MTIGGLAAFVPPGYSQPSGDISSKTENSRPQVKDASGGDHFESSRLGGLRESAIGIASRGLSGLLMLSPGVPPVATVSREDISQILDDKTLGSKLLKEVGTGLASQLTQGFSSLSPQTDLSEILGLPPKPSSQESVEPNEFGIILE